MVDENDILKAGFGEPLNRGQRTTITEFAKDCLEDVSADKTRYNLNDMVTAMEKAGREQALVLRRHEEERGEKERG